MKTPQRPAPAAGGAPGASHGPQATAGIGANKSPGPFFASFDQPMPRTPQEAFNLPPPAAVDQEHLDEDLADDQPPRQSTRWWLAAGVVALTAWLTHHYGVWGGPPAPEPTGGTANTATPAPSATTGGAPENAVPSAPATSASPDTQAGAAPTTTTPPVAPPPATPPTTPATTSQAPAEPARPTQGSSHAAPGDQKNHHRAVQLLQRAAHFYKKGKPFSALPLYQQAAALEPDSDAAHEGLGSVYFDLNKSDLAIEHLTRAVELNPQSGRAWVMMGNVHHAAGNAAKAREAYQRYLQIEPDGRFAADVKILLDNLPQSGK